MRTTLPGFFLSSIENLHSIPDKQIVMLGVPLEGPKETKKGAKKIPNKIRRQAKNFSGISSSFNIHNSTPNCYDIGNIKLPNATPAIETIWEIGRKKQHKIMAIGGDHLTTYYMLKNAPIKPTDGIISFDAHADFAEEYPKNVRKSHATVFSNLVSDKKIFPSQFMLIGGNAYTQAPEENEIIEEIEKITPLEILQDKKAVEEKITSFIAAHDNLYVTIDLDCLDLLLVPTLGTGEPFGLDTVTLKWLLSIVLPNAVYVDIVEGRVERKNNQILKLIIGLIYQIVEFWSA